MRSAGEITFADAHKQRVGDGWALFGIFYAEFHRLYVYIVFRVVEYATYDDMKNAMRKLDGAELNGRRLKLTEDYRGRKRRLVIVLMYTPP